MRAGDDGEPVTDGVFPESKEFLAGYLIVDVDGREEACKLAARASQAPRPAGFEGNTAIEVRPSLERRRAGRCAVTGQLQDDTIERLLRELTPLAPAPWFAAFTTSRLRRTPCRRRRWTRRSSGRAQVCPTIHARGSRRSPFDG